MKLKTERVGELTLEYTAHPVMHFKALNICRTWERGHLDQPCNTLSCVLGDKRANLGKKGYLKVLVLTPPTAPRRKVPNPVLKSPITDSNCFNDTGRIKYPKVAATCMRHTNHIHFSVSSSNSEMKSITDAQSINCTFVLHNHDLNPNFLLETCKTVSGQLSLHKIRGLRCCACTKFTLETKIRPQM